MGIIFEIQEKMDVPLDEMANLHGDITGVKDIMYLSTMDSLKNAQAHALGRVKLIRGSKKAFVTIKKNKAGNRIAAGDDRMVNELLKFVEKNEEVLWDYWNTPLKDANILKLINALKK